MQAILRKKQETPAPVRTSKMHRCPSLLPVEIQTRFVIGLADKTDVLSTLQARRSIFSPSGMAHL
jgi:hypothetical protein